MAYEDRSSPPQQNNPNRHSTPDPRYLQPQTNSYPATQAMPEPEPARSRGSSSARQDGYTSDSSRYSQTRKVTKPINEAISSAFNSTHAADSGIPPELLERLTSQITANVINQLKSTNIQSTSSTASQVADNNSSPAGSPPLGRASVYTPPSPNRPAEDFPQPSPRKSDRASPPLDRRHSPDRSVEEFPQPSPKRPERASPPQDRRPSPLNQYDHAEDSDAREGRTMRPTAPQRISTGGDLTVLEKIWGKLFDANGDATPRLGQFLRGVAVHLIEDYEPKHSLVITPPKMQQFYQTTKVTNEIYPWQVVFDDRTSSISRMLRELEAEHHLVQDKVSERPDIPGLTPKGFEAWATLLIRAHPEQEFERLAMTAMNMPIDNPDDKKERFPKELTRRLFPKQADNVVATKLQKAMSVHCNVTFKTRTESTAEADRDNDSTPQPTAKSSQEAVDRREPVITPVTSHGSSASATNHYRDSKPQSFSSEPAVFDSDEENAPTPQPIERERKPYVAQVGGGKHYDSVDINSVEAEVRPAASTSDIKPPPMHESKLGRSHSVRSNGQDRPRPAPISIHQPAGTAPIEIPASSRQNRHSTYRREGPVSSAPRRTRSPSMSKDTPSGSTRFDLNDTFNQYAQSTPTDGVPGFPEERDRRYRNYESARRERFPEDRYDSARMAAYDPRDRDRDRERADMRSRTKSIAAGLGVDHGRAEEEYYRNSAGYPPPSGQPHSAGVGLTSRERDLRDSGYGSYQVGGAMPPPNSAHYPPNAYRDVR